MENCVQDPEDDLPVGTQKSGALMSIVEAKNSDDFGIPLEPENVQVEGPGPSHGRGMQKKMANKQYEHFWRHNDNDGSDNNTILPLMPCWQHGHVIG